MSDEVLTKNDVDQSLLAISQGIEATKSNAVVTPLDVRLALMDYVDMNIPLYKEHLTDEMLWKCIEWGINQFNETQPHISKQYTLQDFPRKKLLLDSAVVEALRLTALKELRGEMQYSDGGVQSSIYYKSPQFTSLRQELENKVMQETTAIKRSLNISNCYGRLC